MTDQPTGAVDRIPLTHSVRYVVRGLPEVPNQYGPGVLAPSEITLTYRTSPDSQLGRVHAYVAGRLYADGKEIPLLPGGLYGQHYDDGVGDWPEWLAEEARLHDPDAVPVSSPPPDQTALRDRIAAAIYEHMHPGSYWSDTSMPADWRPTYLEEAAAVLAVLPPPADRAAVLLHAADFAEDVAEKLRAHHEFERSTGALDVMTELRRLAAEAQPGCPACGHLTCPGGRPCGVISTERGELPEPCGCTGAEVQHPETPHADRAAVYREIADRLTADAQHGMQPDWARIYKRDAANKVREWADRLDGEAQPTKKLPAS